MLMVEIYLWSKVVCLFCFVLMRSTESGCFRSRSWSLWKALEEEGCIGLVSWHLDLRCRRSWILNDFFTEMKLNCSWKFGRHLNAPLMLLERTWWAGFNGIYFIRFGFRMWEILILKWFLPLKIPKNQVLKVKISWGSGNTWANSTGHTSITWSHYFYCQIIVGF
jgi:hypothetical protein